MRQYKRQGRTACAGGKRFAPTDWLRRGVLGVCAALVLAAGAAASEPRQPARTIETSAEALVEVPADLALLDFGVVTQAASSAEAARENGARMEQVIAALRRVAASEATISTGTYSIRPLYAHNREGGAPRVTGYEVRNVVQVKTRALPRVGVLIDAGVKAGANQMQRLAFSLSDETAPRREALRLATTRALDKARTIAETLGVKPAGIHTVVEHEVGGVRPVMRQSMAMEAQGATPVEPGEVDVRARVSVTLSFDP